MKPNKRSSRLLALALSLVLSLSLSLPALAAGEDDIIYIQMAKDLCALSDSCAYDAWSRGKTVLLTADISLLGVDFEPIASFSGTFNGGGHTISGLTLDIDGIALVFRFVPSVSGEGYEWSASCAPGCLALPCSPRASKTTVPQGTGRIRSSPLEPSLLSPKPMVPLPATRCGMKR